MNSPQQIFIQQTRKYWSVLFTSEILKLSWAALRFVWEILLPAATWQRNLRMESAAAPFQIGHLWWHGLLHHHHQWQLGLTTRCCQRFLRISDGRRQLPITPKSKNFPKLNAFWEELRSILLFVFEKSSAQLELWMKKEQCNESHQFTSDDKKWLHIQGCRFGVSRTWKSNYVNLYQPIFWKKSANVNGKQICKNGTTSRWKPNLYQVTLFHRDGFFKATPNPPFFAAPKKPQMKVKKKCQRQKYPNNNRKTWQKFCAIMGTSCKLKNAKLHGVFTVKVEIKCRKTVIICEILND